MEKIINALDRENLVNELKKTRFIRKTSRGGNEIYSFNYFDSPLLMNEVGRLREISFRDGGGGTGKATDVDKFDMASVPFNQLILWDPDGEQIMGGYRYLMGGHIPINEAGVPISPTSKLFTFSKHFLQNYWEHTMELGRSFIQPAYQPSVNRKKGIYSLDNLWDGLGALVVDNPSMKYFFGKMTMYSDFNRKARDLILYFLEKYFPDPKKLLVPNFPITMGNDAAEMEALFTGADYKENYKILNREVRALKHFIPPLFTAYMNLSATMKSFGTSVNQSFGNVEETGILITIKDIYKEKAHRYIDNYVPVK